MRTGWRGWLSRHAYTIAACLVFLATVVCCWTGFVDADEELYLLGSRRIADPSLLAVDLTWSKLSPTTFLYDHMLAPLWSFLNAFAIVNLGRFVFWGLMAWAITRLARTVRLPAWSAVAGFTIWLLWKQSLGTCGAPFQGFEPKSFAYPLMFLALASVLRGQFLWAGLASGLAIAFHIIVGGWACLALTVSMLVNRKLFPLHKVGVFVLSTAPFVVPLLVAVALFRMGSVSALEQRQMSDIYALFAMPHCCDPGYFMAPTHIPLAWARAAVVFTLALVVVLSWPERPAARLLGAYVAALVVFFAGGLAAGRVRLTSVLTLYPFQLGNALPALFLFLFAAGWIGIRGWTTRLRWLLGVPVLAGTLWLMSDAEVGRELVDRPQFFIDEVSVLPVAGPTLVELDSLYRWIRTETPRNSVFITPLIYEFWPYAERAQVASMRQPPLDRSIIEWKQRLEALNGFRPYEKQGFETETELAAHEPALSIPELVRIRDRYGATHYLVHGERLDLAAHLLHAEQGYAVYDVTRMSPAGSAPSAASR